MLAEAAGKKKSKPAEPASLIRKLSGKKKKARRGPVGNGSANVQIYMSEGGQREGRKQHN